ncbi:MAG: PA0069 family radical SAM protein [Proteobacteria bacterium]|nr:PA0069 family radical SAM protein [Pseudomonadota bacterium]
MDPQRQRNPPLKGRGALSNPTGRFESRRREAVDDGWYQEEVPDFIPTSIEPDRARSVIARNDSPDIPFEQSINPYRGCSHSCPYCYARPSHGYVGLSAGLDFETRLFYKEDAGRVLEAELAKPGYVCKPITLGANTDPYQPIERRMRVTREILEVLTRCRHPVTIITKSALVLRDLDLLGDLARDGLAGVGVSITTLDADLKRVMEPQAASPRARLEAVRRLNEAGVPTGVMVAPVIPALTDHEMEAILEACAAAGARWAGYVLLRLPHEVKDLFREWLAAHYPDRADHVMSLVRQMRGGKDYDPSFGTRMRGTGPLAELLRSRFQIACRRLGLGKGRPPPADTGLFRPPRLNRSGPQLTLDL